MQLYIIHARLEYFMHVCMCTYMNEYVTVMTFAHGDTILNCSKKAPSSCELVY